MHGDRPNRSKFPSPYGAWVSSSNPGRHEPTKKFPSPYGAWVSSKQQPQGMDDITSFPSPYGAWVSSVLSNEQNTLKYNVSVPLRGMGFIPDAVKALPGYGCFRPLTGHGFHPFSPCSRCVSFWFPSPYGAWVSSSQPVTIILQTAGFRPLTGHGFHLMQMGCLIR